jgi:hypothetical protein
MVNANSTKARVDSIKKIIESPSFQKKWIFLYISEDLKITLFNETLAYIKDPKLAHEGEAVIKVVDKKKVGTYQIQKNCQIVKEK